MRILSEKNKMKYLIWIIDRDKNRIKMYKDFLEEENLLKKFKIRRFDVLAEAYDVEGTPDFILIDTTSIMSGMTLYGCFDTAVSMCRGFAEKHKSSNFCIQSAVKRWAEDIIDEITEQFGEETITEAIEADPKEFIKWLKKYTKL